MQRPICRWYLLHQNVCTTMYTSWLSTGVMAAVWLWPPGAKCVSHLVTEFTSSAKVWNQLLQLGHENHHKRWKQASSLLPSLSFECLVGNLCNNWQYPTTTGEELSVALRTTEFIGPEVSPQVKSGSLKFVVTTWSENHPPMFARNGWHSLEFIYNWRLIFGFTTIFIHCLSQ